MADLRLSVAPTDIEVVNLWEPVCNLLIVSKETEGIFKHAQVQTDAHLALVPPIPLVLWQSLATEVELPVLVKVKVIKLLELRLLDLRGSPLVVLVGWLQNIVFFNIFKGSFLYKPACFIIEIEHIQLILVKIELISLILDLCRHHLVFDASCLPNFHL